MRKWIVGSLIVTAAVILALIVGPSLIPGRIDVRPPAFQSSPLSLEAYESSLLVPVSITASRLAEILDDLLDSSFSDSPPINIGGNVHGERLSYTINRGAIAVRADDDHIRITAPLTGRATVRAELCPFGRRLGCSNVRETADLAATARVTLANMSVDPDWVVHVDPDVDVTVTRAEVRLFGDLVPVSFRSELQDEIDGSLPGLTDEFSRLLEAIDLDSLLEEPWDSMHRRVSLSPDGNTWLAIQPQGLGISSLTASSDVLTASVVLSAAVTVNFGDPPEIDRQPLLRKTVPENAAPVFLLRIPVVAELDELASALDECCSPVSVPLPGGGSVTFSNPTLAEHQGDLLLGADFAMSGWWTPRGTVHVLGTPALEGNTLRLDDLEFTVESSSALTGVVAEAARPAILDHLRDALRVDMTEYHAAVAAELDSAIAELEVAPGVDLGIEVGAVELVAVDTGDGMLAVMGEVTGVATIDVVTP